jgi:hypothetical protein
MRHRVRVVNFAILLAAVSCSTTAIAQDTLNPALQEQLSAKFKAAKVGSDGNLILDGSTILVVQSPGVFGIPQGETMIPTGTYKDGNLRMPGYIQQTLSGSQPMRSFTVGEKVYLAKFDASIKHDVITFVVMECDACNGVTEQSFYRAALAFHFPKGSLSTAKIEEVESVINRVFSIDADAAVEAPGASQDPTAAAALAGAYVYDENTANQLQLNADGSFWLRQEGKSYKGSFLTDGKRLTLQIPGRKEIGAAIDGDVVVDPNGHRWVKQKTAPPKLGSLYVSNLNNADRLQMQADGSFSLQEGGQSFTGTYSVSGSTLKLQIAQLQRDVDIAIQGDQLIVNGDETWVQPSPPDAAALVPRETIAQPSLPLPSSSLGRAGGVLYLAKSDGTMVPLQRQEAILKYVCCGGKKVAELTGVRSPNRISQQGDSSFLVSTPVPAMGTCKVYSFEVKNGMRTAEVRRTSGRPCGIATVAEGQFLKVAPGNLTPGEYAFGPSDPHVPSGGGTVYLVPFGVDP